MDFESSGLPAHQTVIKAFNLYMRRRTLMPDGGEGRHRMVETSQILAQFVPDDPVAIALPLLMVVPAQADTVVKMAFDDAMLERLKDLTRHVKTSHAYLAEAQKTTKLVAMAGAMLTFQDAQKAVEMMESLTEKARGNVMGGAVPVPSLPTPRFFQAINNSVMDQTGHPAFEEAFIDGLYQYEKLEKKLQDKIAELQEMSGMPAVSFENGADFRPPSFDSTGLMDNDAVRAAYSVVSSDPRVSPTDFKHALEMGKILSVTGNPAAISYAMLDRGLQAMNQEDFPFLEKRLDWGVVDLLKKHTIRGESSIDKAGDPDMPEEVRQAALASSIVSFSDLKQGVETWKAVLAENPQAEVQIAPMIDDVNQTIFLARQRFDAVRGRTGQPELERMLREKMDQISALTAPFSQKHKGPQPDSRDFPL